MDRHFEVCANAIYEASEMGEEIFSVRGEVERLINENGLDITAKTASDNHTLSRTGRNATVMKFLIGASTLAGIAEGEALIPNRRVLRATALATLGRERR